MGLTQRIYVFSLDFTPVRILLLCAWIRLIARSEYHSIMKMNVIDKLLVTYVLWAIISYTLLWQTSEALIYKLGFASYTLGTYFLIRFYITDFEDIERTIKTLLYLSIFIALIVLVERITHHNYFSFITDVPQETYIREGKLRCFGPFAHPITLGSFGAFLFPLGFYAFWKKNGDKKLGLAGLSASLILVVSSSSSGPVFSLAASIIGLLTWQLRNYMRIILWGIVITITGLEIVMKAHVWALVNRISIFSGSSHYHRFLIIDKLIEKFNEWWLIGIKSTEHWSEYVQLTDVSNNYARVAVDGGILALLLFILIIVHVFRHIGKMRSLANEKIEHQKLFWVLGVALFSYIVTFIGVSLWDQTTMIWNFLIAIIASIKYNNNVKLQKKEQNLITANV